MSYNLTSLRRVTGSLDRPQRVFWSMMLNAIICLVLLFTANITRSLTNTRDLVIIGISLIPTVAIVSGAFWARAGNLHGAAAINTVVLLVFFILGAYAQANIAGIYAFLALGMIGNILVQAFSFNESRFLYILMGAGILAILTLTYFNPVEQQSVAELHRTTTIVLSVISLFVLGYTLFEQFNEYSLTAKFILSVLILAFLSIAVTIVAVSINIQRIVLEDVVQDLQVIADGAALETGEFIAREVRVLETLSSNQDLLDILKRSNGELNAFNSSEIRDALVATEQEWLQASPTSRASFISFAATDILNDFSTVTPEVLGLVLVNKHGQLMASTGNPEQYYFGRESWFFRGYAGGYGSQYVSDPYILERETFDPEGQVDIFDDEDTVIGVDIAVPVLDFPDNSERPVAIGVVKTTLVINELLSDLSSTRASQQLEKIDLVINEELIFHLHEGGIEAPEVSDIDLAVLQRLEPSPDSGQPESEFEVTEIEDHVSYVVKSGVTSSADIGAIDNLVWDILTHQPQADALGIITAQQRTQLLVGIGILLAGSIAAAYIGRLVTSPILRLADLAERISEGERDIRAEVETGDELATLSMSFNEMITQIEDNERNLEQRVAERTRVLETSARIGRSLSTIVQLDALILAVVEQLKDAFDYYHVHIYLLSENGQQLNMVGGSGEIGRQLLAREHSIPVDSGLVGRAATSKQYVLESDVSKAADWKPNDLLTETQAELAVPIMIGEQVLGVLDIQNKEVNSLQKEDADAVEAIAYQVAIAIQNAQLYEQAQREAEREQLINQIGQKIQSTSDMERAMKVALRELGQVLDDAKTVVSLGAAKRNGHD